MRSDLARLRDPAVPAAVPRPLLVALATTGLRVSELCGASDSDVTVEQGRAWLWVTRKGGPPPACAGRPRGSRAARPLPGRATAGGRG